MGEEGGRKESFAERRNEKTPKPGRRMASCLKTELKLCKSPLHWVNVVVTC